MNTIKSNIMLLSYSGYPEPSSNWLHLDNGLALIANSLLNNNFDVKIYDLQKISTWERLYPYDLADDIKEYKQLFYNQVIEKNDIDKKLFGEIQAIENVIQKRNTKVTTELANEIIAAERFHLPKFICMKLWSQASITDQVYMGTIIKKAFPGAYLICGGPAVEMFEEVIFDMFPDIDFAVYCPGENIIVELMECLLDNRNMASVDGIIYREKGVTKKNKSGKCCLIPVDWKAYDKDIYLDFDMKMKNIHVESSRGCNNHCSFCFHPRKSGALQIKKADEFVDEIDNLNRRYGFSYFHLADSNPPFRHIVNISKKLLERKREYGFMTFNSLRDINIDELGTVRKANFEWFWIGVETGSDDLLAKIVKNRSNATIGDVWRKIVEYDFITTASLIIPFPGEDESTILTTLNLLKEIKPEIIIVYPPIVQPGTEWLVGDSIVHTSDYSQLLLQLCRNGIEWHTGNFILPSVFRNSFLGNEILYDGKTLRQVYSEFLKANEKLKGVQRQALVKYFRKRKNASKLFNRLYFEAQIEIGKGIINGCFDSARKSLEKFNEVAVRGKLI